MTLTEALRGINKEIRHYEAKVKKEDKPVNHILHLLLSIITAGFWIPVWIILSLNFNVTESSASKKLEELYELRDEAELKLRMKQ